MREILLDTCALLWIAAGEEIAEEARRFVDSKEVRFLLSPIVAWEMGKWVAEGHVALKCALETLYDDFAKHPNVQEVALEPDILMQATSLPGNAPKDHVDCILVATARRHGCSIMTRGADILRYADEGYVDAIKC